MNAATLFLDVRTGQERDTSMGDPVGALWLPYRPRDEATFVAAVLDLAHRDLDHRIVLICKIGVRSRMAGVALAHAGFRNLFSIAGGVDGPGGWAAADLPLE